MKSVLFYVGLPAIVLCLFINKASHPTYLTSYDYQSAYNDTTTIEGIWVLQPVLASDTAAGKLPNLDFNLASKKFTGNTGCNDISGRFLIEKDSLVFEEHVVATKNSCKGYNEDAFVQNLTKTNHYKIEDGVLQLMNDQTILSKWTRKADLRKSNKV